MKNNLIKILILIIFLPAGYLLGSIYLSEITKITEVRRVTGTSCTASENGNCYCWDYSWSPTETNTRERCEKEGEKCTSWNTHETSGSEQCTAHADCGCYSGPELHASCIKPSPCVRTEKVTEKKKRVYF